MSTIITPERTESVESMLRDLDEERKEELLTALLKELADITEDEAALPIMDGNKHIGTFLPFRGEKVKYRVIAVRNPEELKVAELSAFERTYHDGHPLLTHEEFVIAFRDSIVSESDAAN